MLGTLRGRPDRLVLLAALRRNPDRDPGAVGREPDPPAPRVLAVVVGEVAPDPLLEPLLAERPAQHRLRMERPGRRVDDHGEVVRRGGPHFHHRSKA
jgi:hypothetical protein